MPPTLGVRDRVGPDTVCLYHFSIGSAASRYIFHAPDRLVIRYHNITPGRFFAPFMPHLARQVEDGRRQLALFAERSELGLGVSEFNRRELESAGYRRTGVFPIFPALGARRPARPVLRRMFHDGRTNLLFVGRVICNKKIEDLLRMFAVYQRYLDPKSRLLVVGDTWGYEAYYLPLERMARELGLEEVVFTGQVEDDELPELYALADAFVGLSEHEGFCVPLSEAMSFGVPVLAYDAGAVAETLDGGGVLLKDKRPEQRGRARLRGGEGPGPAHGRARHPGAHPPPFAGARPAGPAPARSRPGSRVRTPPRSQGRTSITRWNSSDFLSRLSFSSSKRRAWSASRPSLVR